jgi:hypothetical protein
MTGEDWWLAAAVASGVLLVIATTSAMVLARSRLQRIAVVEQDRDHWQRVAGERGAEAERLARESARLIDERAELLARMREADEQPAATTGPIDRDTTALHELLRRAAPAASLASAPGPRGPTTSVSLADIAGMGQVRPLHAVPDAVERARERGLLVQPSDQGRRFAIAADADAVLGAIATALLEDARERLGRGAQVQLALQWESPAVVVRLTPF